jgi:hypothetical protein
MPITPERNGLFKRPHAQFRQTPKASYTDFLDELSAMRRNKLNGKLRRRKAQAAAGQTARSICLKPALPATKEILSPDKMCLAADMATVSVNNNDLAADKEIISPDKAALPADDKDLPANKIDLPQDKVAFSADKKILLTDKIILSVSKTAGKG